MHVRGVELGPMWWRVWRLLAECPVWAMVVIVTNVLLQHRMQIAFPKSPSCLRLCLHLPALMK